MSSVFPEGTSTVKVMTKLIRCDENLRAGDRMSARMTRSAVKLEDEGFIGWQMIVPRRGAPRLAAFGSEGVTEDDLEWFAENNAITGGGCGRYADLAPLSKLYELVLPLGEEKPGMGFCSESGDHSIDAESIIKQVEDELEEELILNRHKIEGALFTPEIKRDLCPVSELVDNEKIRRDLENEGIKRAADILGKRPEELPRSARAHLKPLRERLIAHYRISVNDPMLRLPFFGKKG